MSISDSVKPASLETSPAPALGAPAPGTPIHVQLIGLALVVVPMLVLGQVLAHTWFEHIDDQMFGYFGWRLLQGDVIYLDVWDNKPPAIYWLNALGFALGGGHYAGVIALCTLAMVVTIVCFHLVATTVYGRASAVCITLLGAFFILHPYLEAGNNRTETFLVPLELMAVLLYVRGFAPGRDRWWRWLIAGLCCGGAFMFKQIGLAAWGAMGLHTIVLVIMRRLPWRPGLRRCVLLTVGAATTVALAALLLLWQGGMPALNEAVYATFGFNKAYFDVGNSHWGFSRSSAALIDVHMRPLLTLPLLMAAAAVLNATLRWLRPAERLEGASASRPGPSKDKCPAYMFLFTVWFLAALYGAMLSPTKYRWYVSPMVPPLLLMAGYLIDALRGELGLLTRVRQRAWVAAAVVIMGYFATSALRMYGEEIAKVYVFRYESRNPDGWRAQREWEVVGNALLRVTKPGDKVQCWGWLPGVYFHSRLQNACRFATTEKAGQVRTGANRVLEEVAEKLRNRVPAALAIRVTDYKWVHGQVPDHVPEVLHGPLIDANYELVEEIPAFNVYIFKRKEPTTAP